MGYIETVLGYGGNHVAFPIRMIFSKIVRDNGLEIALDTSVIEEVIEHGSGPLEAHLQDDIFLEEAPDERVLSIDCEDDLYDPLSNSYVSTEYGCRFGSGCCFKGIIVHDDGSRRGGRRAPGLAEGTADDLEEKLLKAKKWVTKLKEQKRLPDDLILVMKDNCCS
jgi:hypothetical protein